MNTRRTTLIAILSLVMLPAIAQAAGREPLDNLPFWTLLPFFGLLVTIALVPVLAAHFWHSNWRRALVVLLFAAPVAVYMVLLDVLKHQPGIDALVHGLQEYASFIILLTSLYIVAGGILIQGDLRATPAINTLILGLGAVLANLIGTTGASMVLIRPYLRFNRHRQRVGHLPLFFIFLVSNLGGLLTPLGDPPLFLGFLRGVDFFWTFRLWPQWLAANGLVLGIFFLWDWFLWAREPEPPGPPEPPVVFHIRGRRNLLFLGGILAAILLQSRAISGALTQMCNRLFPCPDLWLVWPWADLVLLLMCLLSLVFTPRAFRQANRFGWSPILEVAILFLGIFVTMVPALDLLARHGGRLGLAEPWHYFWLTGSLSSFLDNAPTYVTFAAIASGGQPLGLLARQAPAFLEAISCGAVFMGAMTYIGNGPNFMVKAIAEENGIKTPSFPAYLGYSCLVLLPVFLGITLVFF